MNEKPLHVQVAEAITGASALLWHFNEKLQRPMLGPNPTGKTSGSWALPVCVRDPGFTIEGRRGLLFDAPLYDQDWSATGPLIERYGIHMWRRGDSEHGAVWVASDAVPEYEDYSSCDQKALVAVCRLILALKAAGKLEPAA